MDEQQLRALVRDAIARHLGPGSPALAPPSVAAAPASTPASPIAVAQFHLTRPPGEIDCVIEPAVTCTHCGHCLCYGH